MAVDASQTLCEILDPPLLWTAQNSIYLVSMCQVVWIIMRLLLEIIPLNNPRNENVVDPPNIRRKVPNPLFYLFFTHNLSLNVLHRVLPLPHISLPSSINLTEDTLHWTFRVLPKALKHHLSLPFWVHSTTGLTFSIEEAIKYTISINLSPVMFVKDYCRSCRKALEEEQSAD